ncbi:MAG: (2Fe-2S) ferredoxin domain-containing protein [Rhodospirillales bacterium]|nr:(2Fe-2S) ferredoxin domain-containing protein [Rhodospirillales bacterium]
MTDRPEKLLICINRRFGGDKPSCAARGSISIADAIEAGTKTRRIALDVERIVCLGQCLHEPSMRLAPGGRFFLGIQPSDVEALLAKFEASFGPRVEEDDTPPIHLLGS